MDICITSANPSGCGHFDVTVSVDGAERTLHLHDDDLFPITASEWEPFIRLCLRRLKQTGVTLAQLPGRVTYGEEATNVKSYDLIAPGAAVTKTNIGTAYSNVLPGANGQRSLVDFTGCTQFQLIASANLVGTGQWGLRVVRDSDDAVLFENANLGVAGERELDTNWQALPVAASGQTLVRVQAKSQTAADDPVFRRVVLVVR